MGSLTRSARVHMHLERQHIMLFCEWSMRTRALWRIMEQLQSPLLLERKRMLRLQRFSLN